MKWLTKIVEEAQTAQRLCIEDILLLLLFTTIPILDWQFVYKPFYILCYSVLCSHFHHFRHTDNIFAQMCEEYKWQRKKCEAIFLIFFFLAEQYTGPKYFCTRAILQSACNNILPLPWLVLNLVEFPELFHIGIVTGIHH